MNDHERSFTVIVQCDDCDSADCRHASEASKELFDFLSGEYDD